MKPKNLRQVITVGFIVLTVFVILLVICSDIRPWGYYYDNSDMVFFGVSTMMIIFILVICLLIISGSVVNLRRVITACFIALTVFAISLVICSGVSPGGYYYDNPEDMASFRVSAIMIIFISVACLLVILESGVVWLIVRPSSFRLSWTRLIAALAIFTPWLTLFMSQVATHIALAWIWHLLWLAIIVFILIAALIITFAIMLWQWFRSYRQSGEIIIKK